MYGSLVTLLKFKMAPRLILLMTSGSKKKEPRLNQENPVPLIQFQIPPRLKILMDPGSKKGTQIYFSFLSEVPANKPPSGSPTGLLWRERTIYRAFCISLKNLIFWVPQ
jgi:hypothetical protein